LSRQKGVAQTAFFLANNYFLVNLGRFKITQLASNKRPFDYAIEVCLLACFVCIELVGRSNEAHVRRMYTIKSLRRTQEVIPRLAHDFGRLLTSTFINGLFLATILTYFAAISISFGISYIYFALPVS